MGGDELLNLARRVTKITGCPVVGGIAVFLHGYERTTTDIDIYSRDFAATAARLEAEGLKWSKARREFEIEGVPIHFVGDDSLGGPPRRVSTIQGIKVIGLVDIVRGKMIVGLSVAHRAQDVADVIELIRRVPLDKSFAAKLPTELRAPFKKMVDAVRSGS